MIEFIGDLSKQDAKLLLDNSKVKDILEFGVGGSTQIFARECRSITSIDTDIKWIEETKKNLKFLKIDKKINFKIYERWKASKKQELKFDLIFNDGNTKQRVEFALLAWPLLKIGGIMLIHDTRRKKQMNIIADIIKNYFREIDNISFNIDDSNITVIRKKEKQSYINWNKYEGKEKWMIGRGNIEEVRQIKS